MIRDDNSLSFTETKVLFIKDSGVKTSDNEGLPCRDVKNKFLVGPGCLAPPCQ